jgi:predicted kinase
MKIEILCGMIASGKSTYARKRADEGALCVSHDDLTAMCHARYRIAVAHGKDVIVDRTHLTRESRARWINFAKQINVQVIAVAFPVLSAVVHARRRYECDPRGRIFEEWLMVAEHHAEQARLEPLDLSEGFDRIEEIPDVTEARS